ncbi:MAG: GNAT family N-acetyltransferase [Flavobacteriales bacterium]
MRYKQLKYTPASVNGYSLVPIRMEDRELIRTWRNEQMYHLRQQEVLTERQQEVYFTEVVAKLFESEQPTQYLFSYVQGEECMGYGGLVHINYEKSSAELSFIMNTALEANAFEFHWNNYVQLIEEIAFKQLNFNRIFTYAYDVRSHLYPILEDRGFSLERIIPNALIEDGKSIAAVIHSKWNAHLRKATLLDTDITFQWAQDPRVRRYAFTQDEITKEGHEAWFKNKLADPFSAYFILETAAGNPLGSLRTDFNSRSSTGIISYLIDPEYHGKGWGIAMLVLGQAAAKQIGLLGLIGEVMPENSSSSAIFVKLGYDAEVLGDRIRYQKNL